MSEGELILYSTKDGAASIDLRAVEVPHAGRVRMDVAQELAAERFEVFAASRRVVEAFAAEEAAIAQLAEMEKAAKRQKKGGKDA